jgi:hypothetical protein
MGLSSIDKQSVQPVAAPLRPKGTPDTKESRPSVCENEKQPINMATPVRVALLPEYRNVATLARISPSSVL